MKPNTHKIYYFIFAAIIMLSLNSCFEKRQEEYVAVIQKPEDQHISQFLKYYEGMFKTQFNASECPGAAIAIVKDTNIIFLRGFGQKKVGESDSVDVNTLFRIGSLSKGFTAVLTGILVEKGMIGWNDLVVGCLPDFCLKDQDQANRICVANLLSHSTGLPRHTFTNLLEEGQSIDEIMLKLKDVNLLGTEGKSFAYQNLAYSVIEEIMLKKTGEDYNELLKQYILTPGEMNNASVSYEDMMCNPNRCSPHARTTNHEYVDVPCNKKYYNAVSVGGINASISDMANWLKILMGEREDIVSDSTLDYIFSPYVNMPDRDYYDLWDGVLGSSYGMGWRILDYGKKEIVYHAGFVNDFRSEIAIDRENKIGICVLFNAQNSYARHVVPTFFSCYDLYKTCLVKSQ